jgi:hypothetical protein
MKELKVVGMRKNEKKLSGECQEIANLILLQLLITVHQQSHRATGMMYRLDK